MLRDVFYYKTKPNVHPREKFAVSLDDARQQCSTEHFWIINESCDYQNFDWDWDFEFLPDEDVWTESHNNVWPSQHQKDSGTWLCPKEKSDIIVYRADVDAVNRKNKKTSHWVMLDLIDESKFDFSWHPDPVSPPYIYKWGCKFFSAQLKHVLEYHVPGATQVKYMDQVVELAPELDKWVISQPIDTAKFDLSWRPNPNDPPYIYVWGNKYIDGKLKSTIEYHATGAVDRKYIPNLVEVLPEWDKWDIVVPVDKSSFDFTWRPDPREPNLIYVFGNKQHEGNIMPTIEYRMPGATERKYLDIQKAKLAPQPKRFEHLENSYGIDYSWVPDPTSPPYIYAWGNQWNKAADKISIQYVVEGATEYMYMDACATRKPCLENWSIPEGIDYKNFDYSWEPSPADPAFIYEFGTQWQKTGGPRYHVEGATEVKYMDIQKVKKLVDMTNWTIPNNIDVKDFDFSWHPDDTSPPYIYNFPTQWALSGGPVYTVPGATEIKYIEDQSAKALPDRTNWEVDSELVDVNSFDFSWHPYAEDEPYVYQFGTQWQKTGGPKYITPGVHKNSPVSYVDTRILKARRLPCDKNFAVLDNAVIKEFDFSWHPDDTEEPYTYIFGNNFYPAEIMATVEYNVSGATRIKYVNNVIATLGNNKKNWKIHQPIDDTAFDFSWVPNPKDPPYIYVWGNKYIEGILQPTIEYHVPEAVERNYVTDLVKVTPEWDKWYIPDNLNTESFDFTWRPDPREPAFIYEFPTQWQKTGGPKYTVPSATEIKYVDLQKVKVLPSEKNWTIPNNVDIMTFDLSWHPDDTSPPYIYQFGTQWALSGGPKYIVKGATEVKYIDIMIAKATPNRDNWEYDSAIIDIASFDFSWHPYAEDEPYIYQIGTQHQKTGGPRYLTPGTHKNSPVKYIDTRIIKAIRLPNKKNWRTINKYVIDEFDYSWHPDDTEEPFIYVFGNQYYSSEIMPTIEYYIPVAAQYKYVNDIIAKLGHDKNFWDIPKDVDVSEFDFSWKPNPHDPPLIYEFGTQWQKTGGPQYKVTDATEIKYVDTQKVKRLPNNTNWTIPTNVAIDGFDFSWHPDATSPPYIYNFPTQWALSGGPVYTVPGATEAKYAEDQSAKALPDRTNWEIPEYIDDTTFDFSWHPYVEDQPYVYQFGTQWQKTGGIRYITPGVHKNSPIKYIDTRILKSVRKPSATNWEIPEEIDDSAFDYSWHPDDTEEPYIYEFGTQWQKTGGPKYVVPTAKKFKYVDTQRVKKLSNHATGYWSIPSNIDITGSDWSWHPDSTEEPFIYHFPTEWQSEGGPTYKVPGATEYNYMTLPVAKTLSVKTNWEIPAGLDTTDFKFNWHPHPKNPAYIYEFGTQWQKTGGPKYVVPTATEVNYIDRTVSYAKRLPNNIGWSVLHDLKIIDFDYSWHPDDTEEPYIYEFGNSHHPAEEMPTVSYAVPGAVQVKYVHDIVATLAADRTNWEIPKGIDIATFDFSWKPSPLEPAYIYQFGTQHQKTNGPRYIVPDATEVKYIDKIKATALPTRKNWKIPDKLDISEFDFSWHPDDTSPAYIYQFGTQWALTGGPRYAMRGATEVKYVEHITARAAASKDNWEIPTNIAENEFDFSWHPYAEDDPFIYQFGTQHQKTGGPRYVVPGATKIKYIDTRILKARSLPSRVNWVIPDGVNASSFDFSWHPDKLAPNYIYQFGTLLNKEDGPTYVSPNTNAEIIYLERVERKETDGDAGVEPFARYTITTNLEDLINQHPNELFWALNPDLDYSAFDFDWRPNIEQSQYVHAFGSQDNINTQTYFVNAESWLKGFTDVNYVEDKIIDVTLKIDMFFVDRGNPESQSRFEKLKTKFPNMQKTRYLNTWVETINRCTNRATSNLLWVLNSELDYTDFDFEYYPNPWQMKMVHVFGTQWSHWGSTFMVNKNTFSEDTKYIKIIEHLSNLNFVKTIKATATKCIYDIVVVDHGNSELANVIELMKRKAPEKTVSVVKYNQSYLNTLKDVLSKLVEKREHYIWVCSSVCDYSTFDFSYICDPFARDQLHVFPSGKQKFGDTFFLDVNKAKTLINEITMLEEYNKVNYNSSMRVIRLPEPTIVTSDDTLVDAVKRIEGFPYAVLITEDNKSIDSVEIEPMNLWSPETKNILITSTGATRIVVPREAKDHVQKELYDYPYIKKSTRLTVSRPMDIVFLSNGETGAEQNWEHLQKITKGLKNRVVRVDGINGRVAAYHAAVEASETPWAFTVFAKLKASAKFDWNWQPDRMQVPKHYIFQAKNPVNGLIYGHQAMIAYNKKLTLANEGKGLDFTLDDEHEVVELLSGIAQYNTDEFSTWRTAFREVLKLKAEDSDIARARLDTWLNKAEGNFFQHSIKGAIDADEYYDEVDGDFDKLKLSYEWKWLKTRFDEL